jgi:hypothetical protein
MLQGWNWYAGSDPSQIGASQYDFETTVLHELGHALGLGGATDPTSPMFETLAAGSTVRTVTTADLNISDPPAGADPQMAAGFAPPSTTLALSPSGFAVAPGSSPNPAPAGVIPPLSSSSDHWRVVSRPGPWAGGPTGPQVSPEPGLILQELEPARERGLVIRMDSVETNPRAGIDLDQSLDQPSVQPTNDLEVGSEHPVMRAGTDYSLEPVAKPSGVGTDPVADWALDELASEVVLMRGVKTVTSIGAEVLLPVDRVPQSKVEQEPHYSDNSWLNSLSAGLPPVELPGQRIVPIAGLAGILLAARLQGRRATTSTRSNHQAGRFYPSAESTRL